MDSSRKLVFAGAPAPAQAGNRQPPRIHQDRMILGFRHAIYLAQQAVIAYQAVQSFRPPTVAVYEATRQAACSVCACMCTKKALSVVADHLYTLLASKDTEPLALQRPGAQPGPSAYIWLCMPADATFGAWKLSSKHRAIQQQLQQLHVTACKYQDQMWVLTVKPWLAIVMPSQCIWPHVLESCSGSCSSQTSFLVKHCHQSLLMR